MRASFVETARDGQARCGVVTTARGEFMTPRFMPVGTRGAIVHLDASDVEALGAQVILANTYHLMMRPGADVVETLGGIHGMADWDGHVLTDSGGYQIFSLRPELSDEGATFKSTYDGSTHLLTPEGAVDVQAKIGADIQMVLDVCPSSIADLSVVRSAVERTGRWAERGRAAFLDHPDAARRQCQFGIVQGGTDEALREQSARQVTEIGFDGYDDMRECFRNFVVSDDLGGFGDRARWLEELAAGGGASAVLAEMGEAVKAVVQLVSGVEPNPGLETELLDYARQHLAHYKCPRSVDFVDELPRLPTGKLYKRLLKDQYWGRGGSRIV